MGIFDKVSSGMGKGQDVLTLGEILVDLIGDEGGGDSYRRFFGGSPANIAANLSQLGLKANVASCVGKDDMGDFLISRMEAMQLDTGYIQRSTKQTSMVVLRKSRNTPIPIFCRGADCDLRMTAELAAAIGAAKVLHFSCWPISQPTSRATVLRAIQIANEAGTIVSFDPNYHPALWQEGHDAVSFIRDIVAKCDIVKPSLDDANRLFGSDTAQNHAKHFVEMGAQMVLLSMGDDGVLLATADKLVSQPAVPCEVVDTTGAGDAFWSGFYAALLHGAQPERAVQMGQMVSAIKLKYVGAIAPLPHYDELSVG